MPDILHDFPIEVAPSRVFHYTGWPNETEHYRVSCYCWAMYLRVLRRYLEHGERVPYERRLDA